MLRKLLIVSSVVFLANIALAADVIEQGAQVLKQAKGTAILAKVDDKMNVLEAYRADQLSPAQINALKTPEQKKEFFEGKHESVVNAKNRVDFRLADAGRTLKDLERPTNACWGVWYGYWIPVYPVYTYYVVYPVYTVYTRWVIWWVWW